METETLSKALEALSLYKNHIERRTGERIGIEKQLQEAQSDLLVTCNNIEMLSKVNKVYQLASQYARTKAKSVMESLVTKAFQCVYDEEMALRIDISPETETKTEAELVILTDSGDGYIVESDPDDGDGGGVSDVVSLASQISMLETIKPKIEGPLLLDEPGKQLGVLNRRLAPFLDMITKSFGRQIIMASHDDYLIEAAHRAFYLTKKNGITQVRQA